MGALTDLAGLYEDAGRIDEALTLYTQVCVPCVRVRARACVGVRACARVCARACGVLVCVCVHTRVWPDRMLSPVV